MLLCVSVSDRSARVTVVSVFQIAPCCVCFRSLHVVSVFQIALCCVLCFGLLHRCVCFRSLHVVSVFQIAPCCVCVSERSMLCLCFRALHVVSVFQSAPCCVCVSERSMLLLCPSVSDRFMLCLCFRSLHVVSVFQIAPCCVCVSDRSMLLLCPCFRSLHVVSVFQSAPCCVCVSDRSMLLLFPCFRSLHVVSVFQIAPCYCCFRVWDRFMLCLCFRSLHVTVVSVFQIAPWCRWPWRCRWIRPSTQRRRWWRATTRWRHLRAARTRTRRSTCRLANVTGLVIYPVICILGLCGNTLCIVVMSQRQMRSSTQRLPPLSRHLGRRQAHQRPPLLHRRPPLPRGLAVGKQGLRVPVPVRALHLLTPRSACPPGWRCPWRSKRYIYVCHPTNRSSATATWRAPGPCPSPSSSASSLLAIPYAHALPDGWRWSTTAPGPAAGLWRWRSCGRTSSSPTSTPGCRTSCAPSSRSSASSPSTSASSTAMRRCRIGRSKSGRRHRITVMLIFVILIFLVCITPDAVMSTFFGMGYYEEAYLQRGIREITDLLLLVNSASNFVLYCIFNTIFWKNFVFLFCGRCYPNRTITEDSNMRRLSLVGRPVRSTQMRRGSSGGRQRAVTVGMLGGVLCWMKSDRKNVWRQVKECVCVERGGGAEGGVHDTGAREARFGHRSISEVCAMGGNNYVMGGGLCNWWQ